MSIANEEVIASRLLDYLRHELHNHSIHYVSLARARANEAGYALEGEVEDQDGNRISYKGLFSVTPKGVEHSGGIKFTKDSVVLLSWDGPR